MQIKELSARYLCAVFEPLYPVQKVPNMVITAPIDQYLCAFMTCLPPACNTCHSVLYVGSKIPCAERSRFPQTVEVAVGVDRFDLVALAESEADLGLLAGVQLLTLVALLGVERDPLDVVLRQHGMLHGADLDMNDAVFHCPDRDMLLHGRVGRAGDDLAHRLTAADDGNARILDLGNDVAAMLANVKLLLHDSFFFSL